MNLEFMGSSIGSNTALLVTWFRVKHTCQQSVLKEGCLIFSFLMNLELLESDETPEDL